MKNHKLTIEVPWIWKVSSSTSSIEKLHATVIRGPCRRIVGIFATRNTAQKAAFFFCSSHSAIFQVLWELRWLLSIRTGCGWEGTKPYLIFQLLDDRIVKSKMLAHLFHVIFKNRLFVFWTHRKCAWGKIQKKKIIKGKCYIMKTRSLLYFFQLQRFPSLSPDFHWCYYF